VYCILFISISRSPGNTTSYGFVVMWPDASATCWVIHYIQTSLPQIAPRPPTPEPHGASAPSPNRVVGMGWVKVFVWFVQGYMSDYRDAVTLCTECAMCAKCNRDWGEMCPGPGPHEPNGSNGSKRAHKMCLRNWSFSRDSGQTTTSKTTVWTVRSFHVFGKLESLRWHVPR
jgi:hypothetical protein